ncbi:hypothetical protein KJ780_05180 [Candidatus Micrarchaeota archaeon]|nr:hypothetical protein [Candidatus Micrarchaeota archaeon]
MPRTVDLYQDQGTAQENLKKQYSLTPQAAEQEMRKELGQYYSYLPKFVVDIACRVKDPRAKIRQIKQAFLAVSEPIKTESWSSRAPAALAALIKHDFAAKKFLQNPQAIVNNFLLIMESQKDKGNLYGDIYTLKSLLKHPTAAQIFLQQPEFFTSVS